MEFKKTFAIYNDISHAPFNKIYFIIMSQPINPPTKVSLWSSDMSDAERLVHERLLLVFKEANETFNGAMLGEHLSDDIKYTSQNVHEDMEGKNNVAQYLVDRYKFFEEKKEESRRTFERGYVDGTFENQPCLVISINEDKVGYISISVNKDEKISSIDNISSFPPVETVKIVKHFTFEKLN